MIEETCANPKAEDAGVNFLNINAKVDEIADLQANFQVDEMHENVQSYTETVCGYEKSQHILDIKDIPGYSIAVAAILIRLKVIIDILENSKDFNCKYKICNMHFQTEISHLTLLKIIQGVSKKSGTLKRTSFKVRHL